MSGAELIRWAVAECDRKGIPPTDEAILRHIRELPIVNRESTR